MYFSVAQIFGLLLVNGIGQWHVPRSYFFPLGRDTIKPGTPEYRTPENSGTTEHTETPT